MYSSHSGPVVTPYRALRLPNEYAPGCDHAFARNVNDSDPYGVRVRLTSAEAVAEAHRFAGEAYDRVLSG